jgi:hypothetical protein
VTHPGGDGRANRPHEAAAEDEHVAFALDTHRTNCTRVDLTYSSGAWPSSRRGYRLPTVSAGTSTPALTPESRGEYNCLEHARPACPIRRDLVACRASAEGGTRCSSGGPLPYKGQRPRRHPRIRVPTDASSAAQARSKNSRSTESSPHGAARCEGVFLCPFGSQMCGYSADGS